MVGALIVLAVAAVATAALAVGRFDDDGSAHQADVETSTTGDTTGDTTGACNAPVDDHFCPEERSGRSQMASPPVRARGQVPEPPGESVTFTAGGDIGAEAATTATLEAMSPHKGEFFLALGDLSYSDLEPESAWCDYIASHLGADFPVQLVVGNHEDDDRSDGYIGDFAACMPDRMNSVGVYAAEYYFDVGKLARIIMIGADNEVGGVAYDYREGSPGLAWLEAAIADAGQSGIQWVIVGMHKVCLTAGTKGCDIGSDLMQRLIDWEVDLVLAGHDHNYQRSKQLRCAEEQLYVAACAADDGSDGVYTTGEGTVFVITGLMGGGALYPIDETDPEYQYMATTMGAGDDDAGYGFSVVRVDDDEMHVEFVGSTTSFSDAFSIRRRRKRVLPPLF